MIAIWSAFENRSPFVWIAVVVVFAVLAVIIHFARLARKEIRLRIQDATDSDAAPELPFGGNVSVPDWPIHELFLHIDPELLEPDGIGTPDRWEIVAVKITDQLAMACLKSWGRSLQDQARPPAMREIDSSYWYSSAFTFWFLEEQSRHKPHTSGLPEYTDVQVNRAQALRLWPIQAEP
jgi:hypothetical protein